MWSKIYLITLAISLSLMGFFTYYSNSWLGSIGSPASVIEGYSYYSNLSWIFLWISSVVLLILANFVLAKNRRSWVLWATFIFFSVFVVIHYFWLELAFFQFKKANGVTDSSFTVGPFFAALLVLVTAAVVYSDQFIVTRLRDKIYPPEIPVENVEEPPAET